MARINLAFQAFPEEAALVGRMLLAFGELEYRIAVLAGMANGDFYNVLKALYRLRATSSRIEAADALLRPTMHELKLNGEYAHALGAVRYCLRLRNQFAHCNWAGDSKEGLFFADLEGSAGTAAPGEFIHEWRHVDKTILEEHESYFEYAITWLYFLEGEINISKGYGNHNDTPKPKALLQPLLHNPPEKHIPPWLTEDLEARHLRRVREWQESLLLRKKDQPPQDKGD